MRSMTSVLKAVPVLAVVAGASLLSAQAQAQPVNFTVDPYWMKALPNIWVTGVVGGLCLGARNHVFVVTQGFQTGGLASPEGVGGAIVSGPQKGTLFASTASAPVIELDQNGFVVNSWGDRSLVATGLPFAGQNAVMPNGIHGCFADAQGNVWVAGAADGVVQKYSASGSMLMQIGTKFSCDDGLGGSIPCTGTGGGNVGRTGSSQTLLNQPTAVAVDSANGDVYIADGGGNHRVVVFDQNGNYLRQLGGVGTGAGQFASAGSGHPACVVLPNNGYVYACDRGNDRINVYTKAGASVGAIPVIPGTAALGTAGSAGAIAFSPDSAQTYLYVADGSNERVWIMNHAAALAGSPTALLGSFGNGFGHDTGEFTLLDTIIVDSNGNAYTGESTGGRRLQRFVISQP
jgi:DNA-binding beta-propeller fold protein YncE